MNSRGFTLVEIISVIALLALVVIITIPAINGVSNNIKKNTLKTKIENIEKAAILYAQEHRENFTDTTCSYCIGINNCFCYKEVDNSYITVEKLIAEKKLSEDKKDGSDKVIVNPTDETKYLNDCKIQIYQKYGKIYADYLNDTDNNIGTDCWYQS